MSNAAPPLPSYYEHCSDNILTPDTRTPRSLSQIGIETNEMQPRPELCQAVADIPAMCRAGWQCLVELSMNLREVS